MLDSPKFAGTLPYLIEISGFTEVPDNSENSISDSIDKSNKEYL
jgi:hypothetical protein